MTNIIIIACSMVAIALHCFPLRVNICFSAGMS